MSGQGHRHCLVITIIFMDGKDKLQGCLRKSIIFTVEARIGSVDFVRKDRPIFNNELIPGNGVYL